MASSNSKRTEARANAAIDRYVFGNPDEEVGRAAVGYVRVSTHEQAERGMSLPAQRARIEAYCKLYNLDLISIEEDAGISGEYYDKRPGIQTAVHKCRHHRAVLVSYSLSRVSRALRDILFISEELSSAGADLACISEAFDTSQAAGRMIFKIFGVLAEFERELISERTTMGLAIKRNRLEKISRHSPYGWKREADEQGRLVPQDDEQVLRNRVISMLVAGTHPLKISRTFVREGLKYRGKQWRRTDVNRVISYALKIGELAYADFKKVTFS